LEHTLGALRLVRTQTCCEKNNSYMVFLASSEKEYSSCPVDIAAFIRLPILN